MSTFTAAQQTKHRKAFIEECHQKAWGAACHADHIGKQVDELLAQYQKLQGEDRQLEADIKEAESALDHHTVDNRQKRRGLEGQRQTLQKQMHFIAENAQRGQQAMQSLLQSVETNLELAKLAETWEWTEAEAESGSAKDNVD